jgi:hypothetical protein
MWANNRFLISEDKSLDLNRHPCRCTGISVQWQNPSFGCETRISPQNCKVSLARLQPHGLCTSVHVGAKSCEVEQKTVRLLPSKWSCNWKMSGFERFAGFTLVHLDFCFKWRRIWIYHIINFPLCARPSTFIQQRVAYRRFGCRTESFCWRGCCIQFLEYQCAFVRYFRPMICTWSSWT